MALDKTFASGEILTSANVNGHLLSMWIPIDKRVVTSGSPVSSISWTSIDTNFRIFRITSYVNTGGEFFQLRFNNDSGNNYAVQFLSANATTVSASRLTAQAQIRTDAGSATGGQPYIVTMEITKTLTSVGAAVSGTTIRETTPSLQQFGGTWNNTASLINRIDLFLSAGTMHGVFALEGMRGT